MGIGKIKELGKYIREKNISIVFINTKLSVNQLKFLTRKLEYYANWEDEADEPENFSDDDSLLGPDKGDASILEGNGEITLKVIDRFGLILQIFGNRSKTKIAQYQVAMAYLKLAKSMLKRDGDSFKQIQNVHQIDILNMISSEKDTNLQVVSAKGNRVRGALSGAGQSELEIQREEVTILERRIQRKLDKETHLHAENQKKFQKNQTGNIRVCLIGYTNVGKSALLNKFAKQDLVKSRNMLFQTLFTTSKTVRLRGNTTFIDLVDTIGFISDLPHELIGSFKTTLEGVKYCDIVLHMIDSSHPNYESQISTVMEVLKDLGFGEDFYGKRMIEVWNKVDLLKEDSVSGSGSGKEIADDKLEEKEGVQSGKFLRMNRKFLSAEFLAGRGSRAVALSVKTGEGLDE